jgi:AraC family transcriptional regulator of adaptative response / DNA-3-methyladenine glycosylase II
MIAFLAARAIPGVESVDRDRYRRTIVVGASRGLIDVGPADSGPALMLAVRIGDPRLLLSIVERVRKMFDLGADPAVIAEHLGGDRLLQPRLAAHPGIRTPVAWDGFELAVRAILGQQISVRGATTLAGRIAAMFGSPLAGEAGLLRLFPSPAQLVDAPLERAGVTGSRAATIRSLARLTAAGSIRFGPDADPRATLESLQAIAGIGDWTAQYVALRAFGEPDAFPSGDLVLRRAAGGCTARQLETCSNAWRPWRAYAVMLLWQGGPNGESDRGGAGVYSGDRRRAG